MIRKQAKMPCLVMLCVAWLLCFFAGCENDTDGPLKVSGSDYEFDGEGFFLGASLDSGRRIHLVGDTLYVTLRNVWTFSNCALESIRLNYQKSDSVLWIAPEIRIHGTEEDCASPFYRPDTTLKVLFTEAALEGLGVAKIRNNADSVLDSITLRRGSFKQDTFFVYMDSSFADPHNYPLRTKEKKKSKNVPTILRVLDSITPRVFYWRTMKSTCTHRVDMCNDVVADTLYPTSWRFGDTNLVPVHFVCADSDSVYCINSKWENDSASLGKLQERPDTIWHYSSYYAEKIPKCSSYNSFATAMYNVGQRVRFIRQMMVPDDSETFCGPASRDDWMVYNLSDGKMVLDTGNVKILDSLYETWKSADVAPDTVIVEK